MKKAVLAPDLIGAALTDETCARFLQAWSAGAFQIVTHRALLLRYMRLLHQLGVDAPTLKWWTWWFTAPDKALCIPAPLDDPLTTIQLCKQLAQQAGADHIVGARRPASLESIPEMSPVWTTAAELLPALLESRR